MARQALVSICIPCHNAARYVAQAIDSILAQTWPSIEVIVVDDASTDNSREVLNDYASSRIQIVSAAYGSAAKSRNAALKLAQGDWIKFFDADDLLNRDAVKHQLRRLDGRIDAVASSSWGRFINDDLNTFSPSPQTVWRDMSSTAWLVEAWRDGQPMMQPGIFLIPRPVLERTGGWDENLSLIDDFEFFSRVLCSSTEVLFTPNATLCYRSGLSGSLSRLRSRTAFESAFNSLIKGTGYLLAKRSDKDSRLSCANVMQSFIYDIYPQHLDLVAQMESRIEELGGSDLEMPAGPRMQRLIQVFGWRFAKRLRYSLSGF